MFLFKPRQDLVFGAVDESQYIRLFEEGKDFVLCVDENKIYTGTYSFSRDTVYLVYEEPTAYNRMPPGKLFINRGASNIRSMDGNSFSAEIYRDLLEKPFAGHLSKEWDLVNPLTEVRGSLSLSETGKGTGTY